MTTAIYSDLNPEIGQSPLGELVYDVDAINGSIENILGTRFGERWFFPEFGSLLDSVLFDPMTVATEMIIRTEIFAAVTRWEPRLIILRVDVTSDIDNQQFNVTIFWRYKRLNQVNSISVSLQRL